MDPVTAFSLAAGALSVLDVGFRALSTCREIYQNGYLSEHRGIQEITAQLLETTKQLENSVRSVSVAGTRHSKDVVDISKKCSETATELLSELRKLQQDPKGGFRQTIGKSLRAMRKKEYLAEIQHRLERERNVFNTRILSKLDHHAVLQLQHLDEIDRNVRDLAVALSQGRNTFQQLLADQTIVIRNHVDRRLDDKANEEEVLKSQQKFKDSLFFPEIFARQENISRSHEGTCKWIFGPPSDENEPHFASESSDLGNNYEHEHAIRAQPWSSFKDWLEGDSNDPYWLSGKPGSGKSTLMKYVTTEFSKFCCSRATLSLWRNAVTCCFFFWNLGSSLQKNYSGLLRSLLFQIAEQRVETIPILRDDANSRHSGPHDAILLYAWTEQRLEDALKRFLVDKPPSMRVCMLIDAIDEFVGDEDHLIELIRLLSQTSGIKVCVSSRPEQIYRQGFATSPKLRLQDLNYHDIRKATSDRLVPVLKSYTSCSKHEIDSLVEQVINNSHGVFLWAELMTKDLKTGARNTDSFVELRDRLERTPETIDGLYEHMLNRLDKTYLQDAARYFSYLLAHLENFRDNILRPTLLEFACSTQNPWYHPIRLGSTLFVSENVVETCKHLETRILTRCAGLVEIEECPRKWFDSLIEQPRFRDSGPLLYQKDQCYIRSIREVGFIHKTAVDFLKNHKIITHDRDLSWTAKLAAVRGQIAVASLAPDIVAERESAAGPIGVDMRFMKDIMMASLPSESCTQERRKAAVQTVDDLYNLLGYLNTRFNEPSTTISQTYHETSGWSWMGLLTPERSPFYDSLNFASFFGHNYYLARFISKTHLSQADFERILSCAVLGTTGWKSPLFFKDARGYLVILRDILKEATDLNMDISYALNKGGDHIPLWAMFLESTLNKKAFIELFGKLMSVEQTSDLAKLWRDVVQLFLNRDADPNIMLVYTCLKVESLGPLGYEELSSAVYRTLWFAETPLALIERLALQNKLHYRLSVEDNVKLLGSHGGIKRRVFFAVRRTAGSQYLLTEDQSNRLLSVFTPERLADPKSMISNLLVSDMPISPMPSHSDPIAEELVLSIIDDARAEDNQD